MNSKISLKELCKIIENDLHTLVTEKRLRHILAVKKLSELLSQDLLKLGAEISVEKTVCAALLHDITKCMDQTELCEKYGITLSSHDRRSPETLHAITGEYYARDKYSDYGITEDILSAIRCHTVGGRDMTLLDKIIFISDYCEETRVHEECRKTRQHLFTLLERAMGMNEDARFSVYSAVLDYIMCEILGKTLKYLAEKGDFIHPQTVLTLREIIGRYSDCKEFSALGIEYAAYMALCSEDPGASSFK